MVRIVKDPAERKIEITQTACELFLTKGYENTTMKNVMDALQIAKGTIYHYFKSKEELLDAVILMVAQEEVDRQTKILATLEGNAVERMQQLAKAGSHDSDEHDELLDHLHKPANTGMHIRLMGLLLTLQAPLYASIIEQGCKEGLFTTRHPLECAEFILSGIQFLTDLGIQPWTDEQLARRWQAFPTMVEALLQAPAGSFSFIYDIAKIDSK